jgi:hypothetical protein
MAPIIKTFEYPITADLETHILKKSRKLKLLNESSPIFFITNIHKAIDYTRDSKNKCSSTNLKIEELPDIYNSIKLDYSLRSCDPLVFEYKVITENIRVSVTKKPKGFVSEFLNLYENQGYDPMLKILTTIGLNSESEIVNIIAQALTLPEINSIACFDVCFDDNVNTMNKNIKLESLTAQKFTETMNTFHSMYLNLDKNHDAFLKKYEDRVMECQRDIDILYITKLFIKKRSKVCFFGDIHGAIHTLIRSLLRLFVFGYINSDFTLNSDFYIIFLGDLVDRGLYSIEILYLVMKLKILNPNNVYIIRGNHELCSVNYEHGLKSNFSKLGVDYVDKLYCKYCYIWTFLPAAIYFREEGTSSKYIQACHGGIHKDLEIINKFLYDNDKIVYVFYMENAIAAANFLQWGDFKSSGDEEPTSKNKKRPICTSLEVINYLSKSIIRQVIRGHQDTFDSTKILYHPVNPKYKDNNPNSFKNHPNRAKYFSKDSNSYNIPIPENNENIKKYVGKHLFAPVLTLSTGATSRYVDCDGFSILMM